MNLRPHLKRPFTLVELFIAMTVIVMASSLLLFRAKPMLDHYRFIHAVQRVEREILFAKRVSPLVPAEIALSLFYDNRGVLHFKRHTEEPGKVGKSINLEFELGGIKIEGGGPRAHLSTLCMASGQISEDLDWNLTNGIERRKIVIHPLFEVLPLSKREGADLES